jgi:hypothetical protein
MNRGTGESNLSERWEQLYKDVLFEQDQEMMPRRIECARHAILDRLEDVSCARKKQIPQAGELAALRNAHRALRVLERLDLGDSDRDGRAGKLIA